VQDHAHAAAHPPGWLSGMQRGLVVVLVALPLLLLVGAVVARSWWFALAALPAAGFVVALSRALTYRRLGYHVATEPDGGLRRAMEPYRRASVWSLVAVVLFVLAVLALQRGAAVLDGAALTG